MHTGTKSVLIGAHQFLLHPLFLAAAWNRLYGAPTDPRLWIAFITHDLGYWGIPNMDDERGERHVEFGARLMARLFDPLHTCTAVPTPGGDVLVLGEWGRLSLLHSRFYSRRLAVTPSRLCAADKLAMALEPWWLYLPRVLASGEAWEYLYEFNFGKYRTDPDGGGKDPVLKITEAEVRARRLNRRTWAALREWHSWTQNFLRHWAFEHAQATKGGAV